MGGAHYEAALADPVAVRRVASVCWVLAFFAPAAVRVPAFLLILVFQDDVHLARRNLLHPMAVKSSNDKSLPLDIILIT